MSHLGFLEGILPEGTRYSLRHINKTSNSAFNKFYDSVASMAEAVANPKEGFDVYYVTAGFGAGQSAVSENAVAKRELYVDIDCGPTKSYADKTAGIAALKDFCVDTDLPRPTIVDSGNGLHAHWIFKEAVPVHEWIGAANALKALCKNKGFEVDNACTADIVRVLRIPGTVNSKGGNTVALLTPLRYYNFEKLKGILGGGPPVMSFEKARELSKGASSSVTKHLAASDPNRVSLFETIWMRSVGGTGCAQIKNAVENSETLPEPTWRAVLSIAYHSEDKDWAIHKVSENHPNYSAQETEQKAAATKGPYTCETFQGLDTGHLCKDCPQAGKIKSPIQLGVQIKTAPEGPAKVEIAGRKFEIPAFVWPYKRGANGGVYLETTSDNGTKDELIYPYDLYVYRRMRDSEMGDVIWMRHHLPNDGVREFMVAQREVGSIDKFRDRLNEQGVAVFGQAQLVKLQGYVAKSIQDLQHRDKAEEMYGRFGWTKNNTFIVGDREYTKKGVIYAPVTRNLEKYVPWFSPKGSLEEWKRIAAAYEDPRFDLHAFGVLAGFGSVLMNLSPENGAVVNYYSKRSGTGKTTILRVVNSIFGDPKALMKDAQDTQLTKVHRMGVLNGIAMCLDEMTNTSPQEMSGLLYGSTQGRARDRMEAGRNMERINDLIWKLITIWSSNTNIEDRLSMIKVDPQGEMARVIEFYLQTPVPSDVLGAQKLFNGLSDHYGHAGDVFLKYVVPHLNIVQGIWEETRDVIYTMGSWTQTERYRLNAVICAIAAGVVTNSLGLTNYNVKRIMRTVLDHIKNTVEQAKQQSTKATETFASFINKNVGNMLSIDSKQRANGLQNEAYVKPKGSLMIRYEPDTKDLYIVQKDFNRWCAEIYINTRELPDLFFAETGRKLEVIKKRMGAGWDADFGAVNAYCIKNAGAVLGFAEHEMVTDKTTED